MPTITDLPEADALGGSDLLVVVQSDETRRSTAEQMADYVRETLSDLVLASIGVDTLADLRALATAAIADGATALVRGYAVLGDGGEGLFRWDAAATGTDNGGTLITPDGSIGAGRWERMLFGGQAMVRHFGARGDGVTDDTAAVNRAMAVGPVVFGAGEFAVNGPLVIPGSGSVVWVGALGATRVVRTVAPGAGAGWLTFTGATEMSDIEFDAGADFSGGGRGVWFNRSPSVRLTRCGFLNNGATNGSGSGVILWGSDTVDEQHYTLTDCYARGNYLHGVFLSDVIRASVQGGIFEDNAVGGSGAGLMISLATSPPSDTNINREVSVRGIRAGRQRWGIVCGAYNPLDASPTFTPYAADVLLEGNTLYDNTSYGISLAGYRIKVVANQITYSLGPSLVAGAMALTGTYLTSMGNTAIMPEAKWGIDYGGAYEGKAIGDYVEGSDIGFNVGACTRMELIGFTARDFGDVGVECPGPDSGNGLTFEFATSGIRLRGGKIVLTDSAQIGVSVTSQAAGVVIDSVDFYGSGSATAERAVIARARLAGISGCRWNDGDTVDVAPSGGSNLLIVPDIFDNVRVLGTGVTVGSVFTYSRNLTYGAITGVVVTDPGEGYTTMSISAGGAGSGATFAPFLRDGALQGARIPTGGTGYVPGSTPLTVTGDGTGCVVTAVVDTRPAPNRRLRLIADGGFTLSRAGLRQFQYNGGPDATYVPALGTIDLVADPATADWWLAGSGARGAGNILGQSTVSGVGTGAIGLSNLVSGRCGLALGEFTTVSGFRSVALGRFSHDRGATHAIAHAGNRFSANGDAQEREQPIMGTLVGVGSVRLTADGAAILVSGANGMPLQTSSAFSFRGYVIAKAPVSNHRASWVLEGQGFRNAAGGTITIDGATVTKSSFSTGGTTDWSVTVTADDATGSLAVTLVNASGTQTIRAFGKVFIEEVI